MNPSRNLTLKLELAGIIFITFLGSFLHFTFELSGYNPIVGAFSAVNESVWEHLKLSFWPALIYAVLEYQLFGRATANFFPAKAAGILLMPLIIVCLFYLYTAFLAENLAIDIMIFVVAVTVGQLTSYNIMTWRPIPRTHQIISIAALTLLATLFILFTFYPPRLPIFMDPVSGGFGLNA